MKKVLFILLVVSTMAFGQSLGNRYLWVCKVPVTTTALDCTFSVQWEQVVVFSDTLDLDLKIGAPDISSWGSRSYARLEAGASFSFEAPVRLKKLSAKTVNGTGFLWLVGTKKSRQF